MNKINTEGKSRLFLSIVNVLFLIYWGVLLYFNRFYQDDYGFMAWVRNIGPIDFVSQVYNTFSGRFVRYFIYWFKFKLLGYVELPWLYPTFIYVITVLSIVYVVRKISSDGLILQLGLLCYNLLIFCNLEFSAFFWTAAVDYYATAFLYPLWLFYFCFICKNNKFALLGICACSLLIGGGCEAHSPLFLYVLFAYMIYNILFHKTIERVLKQRLILSFVLIFVGFVIVLIAPGSAGRVAMYTDKPSLIDMIIISLKNVAVLTYLLSFRIPHLIVLLSVSFLAGRFGGKHEKLDVKVCLFWFVCLLGLMWISTFPAAYGMGNLGFQRIYTPIVSTIIVFVAVIGFKMGQTDMFKSKKIIPLVPYVLSAVLCISLVFHIVIDGPTAKAYSDSDKAMIAKCLKEKESGRTEDLFVKPLASCETYNVKSLLTGVLFGNSKKPVLYYGNGISTEIIPDTDIGFSNKCIMDYYQLPFAIYQIKD